MPSLTAKDFGPGRDRGLLAVHAATVLFGFAGLFGAWLALSPIVIVFGRTAVATLALAALQRRSAPHGTRGNARLAAGGVLLALHWLAFFAAIQASSVAIGLLGYATFPLFTLLLEHALLRRRLRARDGLVCALVVLGLVLVVPRWSLADAGVHGLAWAVASGFAFALLAVLNRAEAARRSALEIAFRQNGVAALCLLPFAVPSLHEALPSARDLALVLVLGVVCTALAHSLFIGGLRRVSAHAASVIAALEPVYGMLLAWALLDQEPRPTMWVGAALLVAAAALVAPADAAQSRTPAAS